MIFVNNEGHLLPVDDHHDIAKIVCEYLERSDYVMDDVADGLTGLHFALKKEWLWCYYTWVANNLIIAHSGNGMAKEDVEIIFKPFQHANNI